jgi:hypothetical protein
VKRFVAAIIILLVVGVPASSWALDDTPGNRAEQAERYLSAIPSREMMINILEPVAQMMKPYERRKLFDIMASHDFADFERGMKTAMIKIYSADELQALADFYGSEVGKSLLKKAGRYEAELAPLKEAEMAKARKEFAEYRSK